VRLRSRGACQMSVECEGSGDCGVQIGIVSSLFQIRASGEAGHRSEIAYMYLHEPLIELTEIDSVQR
jgi:hypothetical protein